MNTWESKSQDIALKIREKLLEKDMTQKELGDLCNIAEQFINKITSGRQNMTLKTITRIENALDIQLI